MRRWRRRGLRRAWPHDRIERHDVGARIEPARPVGEVTRDERLALLLQVGDLRVFAAPSKALLNTANNIENDSHL